MQPDGAAVAVPASKRDEGASQVKAPAAKPAIYRARFRVRQNLKDMPTSWVRRHSQFSEQRSKEWLMHPPTTDRLVVDRLAHLHGAGGADRPLCLMKGEATLVPREPTVRNDAMRLAF